jgi:ATP-dependent exoDNAse (exonuclease V) alpha subunit
MRQIVEEAARTGVEVRGLAPSAAAAVQLTSEAGIEATTLQSHLLRRETRSESPKLWIVDEAGMVAAADMHKLLSKAQDSNARVLLVGDTAQLSPIDAGNPFADLQQNTRTTIVRLDESLRQKDPELQKAVAHMNAGDMVKAMETLQNSIHEYKAVSARSAAAARAFLERPEAAHESTLLLARTNETRADLTQRVREGLKQSGVLKNPTLAETFERIDVPESKQHYASSYAEGALLVPNRSYRSLGLEKDTPYEIEKVDAARNTLSVRRGDAKVVIDLSVRNNFSMFAKATIEIAEGDRMIWNRNVKAKGQINNRSFVIEKIVSDGIHIRTDSNETRLLTSKERQHMEHAWALTIYKAQGRTSSAVIHVADAATDARALLVGITRASNNALVMGPAKDTLMRAATREEHKSVAAEVVLESNLQTLPGSLVEGTQRVQERRRSRGRRL